jgi:paraquat-inducible protein A
MDTALACAVAGLFCAIPAALLPVVTVSKLANERAGILFTGVAALWADGMRMVAVSVVICGALTPILLLGTIVALALPWRWAPVLARPLATAARVFEHWAMPEVHVLAMLVALVKLHTLVGVTIGPGFWCYAAMSFLMLLAWNNFNLVGTLPVTSPVGSPR